MKWFKVVFTTLVVVVGVLGLFYLSFSDSYRYSYKAKFEYEMGNYSKAIDLAQRAFELDPYNKMAFAMLTQSKISIKILDYIKDGEEYLKRIDFISQKKHISEADKIKVKMMCEVMLGRFKKLAPTVLTDKKLYKKAQVLEKKFKDIYENLD